MNIFWLKSGGAKAPPAPPAPPSLIFWNLQPLWSSLQTKPDLLRFRCSSGHVLSKTKSVTPLPFFYISDIANSSSFNGKIFRKKSMLEKFGANVLKAGIHVNRSEIWRNIEGELLGLKWVGNTTRQLTTPNENPRLVWVRWTSWRR